MPKYASNLIAGNIGEADVNASTQVRDVTKGLFGYYKDNEQSPLLAFQTKARSGRKTHNIKHEWGQEDFVPRWDDVASITANNGTAAITLTVDNINYFREGQEIQFFGGTGGAVTHAVVTSKTAGTSTIIATSLDGTSLLPTLAADNRIHILGMSMPENSRRPDGLNVQSDYLYNYPSFLRYPTQIGIYELDTMQYAGQEKKRRIRNQMLECKMSWERQLIWGERGKRTATEGTQVFTRGIERWVSTGAGDNVLDWSGGSLTQNTFDEYLLNGPCKAGSRNKMFYMSTELQMQIHSWSDTKQRIQIAGGPVTRLGVAFTRYLAPNGKVLWLHNHHMFEEEYEGHGCIVDMDGIELLPFGKNALLSFHGDIGENDLAGEAFEWRILGTLECKREDWHGYITK